MLFTSQMKSVAYAAIISIAVKYKHTQQEARVHDLTALDHSTRTNIAKNFPLRLPQYDHKHFPAQPYVRIEYSALYTQPRAYGSISTEYSDD